MCPLFPMRSRLDTLPAVCALSKRKTFKAAETAREPLPHPIHLRIFPNTPYSRGIDLAGVVVLGIMVVSEQSRKKRKGEKERWINIETIRTEKFG